MAGSLILFKNETDQIVGACEAAEYAQWLELSSLSFAVSASIQADEETGFVHQSGIELTLPFGPWIAEFQQRLYNGKELGDVTLVELTQAVDAAQGKTWKKVREVKLVHGWVEAISHGWSNISANYQISIQYTDMTFAWGDKIAHYNRSEKT